MNQISIVRFISDSVLTKKDYTITNNTTGRLGVELKSLTRVQGSVSNLITKH